jgi:predicted CXXCH cytochrome family protein
VRRLALLLAAGTLWLFLAAIPALADGGPHNTAENSGMTSLTSDGCAACHRAHTAQGEAFLKVPEEELCLSCHGAGATGATTNVVNGVQFKMGSTASDRDPNAILGALRGGGFASAAIGSDSAVHLWNGGLVGGYPKVPVKTDASGNIAGAAVTSAHLAIDGSSLTMSGVTWGNGPANTTSDPGSSPNGLTCVSCHNPHGNNQYRILNLATGTPPSGWPTPIPNTDFVAGIDATGAAILPVVVPDAPPVPADDTRNYTVIQVNTGGTAAPVNATLLASQADDYSSVSGNYFPRRVPWNSTSGMSDNPNGSAARGTFNTAITSWCRQCHTRYVNEGLGSADAIYKVEHASGGSSSLSCVVCHVSHGSNAQMPGDYSANAPYPGDLTAPVGDSRLLKIDNRGTCQACHDPTQTSVVGTVYPAPPAIDTP